MQRKIFTGTSFLSQKTDFPFRESSPHEARLLASIPLSFTPKEIDVSPDERMLFVSHDDGSGVSFIDIESREVVSRIQRDCVGDVAVSPDGRKLYVTGQNECSVIDIQRKALVAILDSEGVDKIAASPDGSFICLSFRYAPGGLIRMIDAFDYNAESDFDLGKMSNAVLVMAISPQGHYIYASELADDPDGVVSMIDTRDYSQVDIPGFRNPCSMSISADGSLLYVGGFDEMFVTDTATHKILYTLEFGSRGYPVNIIGGTPDNRYVYAIHSCNFDLYRIDTVERTATRIDFFHSVGGAVLNREGDRLYTTHPDRQWISVYAL
ncbi:hypothetical protein PSCICG_28950 [Pseudomonas cichorii]|nr:hypothetical protein PSCICG_28950 [Pseudomonas cichorii]